MASPPKEPLPSLDELQRQIDAATPPVEDDSAPSGAGLGLRFGVELVAGVLVGAGLGFALDRWFGTMPLCSLIGFFLGCAASFMNMKRLVDQLDKDEESATTPAPHPSQEKGKKEP